LRAKFARPREHLDIDQRAGTAKLWQQPLHEIAPIDLEPAIDVPNGDVEETPSQPVVDERVHPAGQRIVLCDAVAADDIAPIERPQQNRQLTEIELIAAADEDDERIP